jgi:hypothetical protein
MALTWRTFLRALFEIRIPISTTVENTTETDIEGEQEPIWANTSISRPNVVQIQRQRSGKAALQGMKWVLPRL